MSIITEQQKALDISVELWNQLIDIPKDQLHANDIEYLRFHIHAIQAILSTSLYNMKK